MTFSYTAVNYKDSYRFSELFSFIPQRLRIVIVGNDSEGKILQTFISTHRPDLIIEGCFSLMSTDEKANITIPPHFNPTSKKDMDSVDLFVICSHHKEHAAKLETHNIQNYILYSGAGGYENEFFTGFDLTYVEENHFKEDIHPKEAKALFKKSVRVFILELTNFCNRRCGYCPVSLEHSKAKMQYIKQKTLDKIIGDLEDIEYNKAIILNFFNEPMADKPHLYETLRIINTKLPKAYLTFHTNGDFLDKESLDMLCSLGIGNLGVSIHLKTGEKYSDVDALNKIVRVYQNLDLQFYFHALISGTHANAVGNYKGMRVNVFSSNYYENGTNRGELLNNIKLQVNRTDPCNKPFNFYCVSMEGHVLPCCHLYPRDENTLRKNSAGNLEDYDNIYEAYTSKLFTRWRRVLIGNKEKPHPCKTCSDRCIW